jgi:DNA-binding MarR family transcriptional regulator
MAKSVEITALIDKFWETIPSLWHQTRAYIRRAAAEEFHITTEQFHTLRRIRGGVDTVSALAEASHTSRPSVSQAVDALVNKGLVRRLPEARDRRMVKLELTAQGGALLSALFARTRQWQQEKFQELSAEELGQVSLAMDVLMKAFPK